MLDKCKGKKGEAKAKCKRKQKEKKDKCKGKKGEAKAKCEKNNKPRPKNNKPPPRPKNNKPPAKVTIPVKGPPKQVPVKGDKGPQNNGSNFKPEKPNITPGKVVGDACVGVNAFMRKVDADVGSRVTSDIQCSVFKDILKAAEKTFSNGTNKMLIKEVSGKLTKEMSCQGDIVANVAKLRRNIAEIACVKQNGKTVIKVVPAKEDAPPLPQGFVIPRLWDPNWNPEWAKTQGWIRHPYYDWLMPVKEIPINNTNASVSKPPVNNPVPVEEDEDEEEDSTIPIAPIAPIAPIKNPKVPSNVPAVVVPSTIPTQPVSDPIVREEDVEIEEAVVEILAEDAKIEEAVAEILAEDAKIEEAVVEILADEKTKKKGMSKYVVWGLVGLVVICIMGLAWWWLKNRGSRQEQQSLNTGDIDQAFDNSAPPSNEMMPGTTDLMNDLAPTSGPASTPRMSK